MPKEDPSFAIYSRCYKSIMFELENNDYCDTETFYELNQVNSDEEYLNILQTGITRPRVFLKREQSEKWRNAFNPFLFNLLQSNTDIQFMTDEYSCAAYVVEYVNKANRGINKLQRQIIKIMYERPDFDVVEITRKMTIDMLNTVEMTSKEAAMSQCLRVLYKLYKFQRFSLSNDRELGELEKNWRK
ncbi:uncharacterized protein TNIN_15371 [Trichonephila inaurata madagascariensis]|uniref:Uncharacterized protein n=1 Tax=Trichonephila inaurata madagascariensis TaxID=2747483 RepID=A0A8X6K9N7_9ARAC|nr:uncharacterized protein TNIN_15371 [Trichonephila inaurata madagascariensis]